MLVRRLKKSISYQPQKIKGSNTYRCRRPAVLVDLSSWLVIWLSCSKLTWDRREIEMHDILIITCNSKAVNSGRNKAN
jgi:hypothetical protein